MQVNINKGITCIDAEALLWLRDEELEALHKIEKRMKQYESYHKRLKKGGLKDEI